MERMLMPMLHVVYDAELHSTHHMYMILIILLILTHDDHFSSYVHDQVKYMGYVALKSFFLASWFSVVIVNVVAAKLPVFKFCTGRCGSAR